MTTSHTFTLWWTFSAIRPLKVVVDAANGMAGRTAPA